MELKRIDENQGEIVAAFRALGWHVADLHVVGHGVPDLIVMTPAGRLLFVEVKNPETRGKLNDAETAWHRDWAACKPQIVYTVDDVRRLALMEA